MSEQSLKSLRVLYVEDEPLIRESLERFLRKHVGKLYCANDGIEGCDLFTRHSPDIIITDARMPRMNGLDMVVKIRQQNAQVPVILTTAYSEEDMFSRVLDMGIDAYIIKPVDHTELLLRIGTLINQQATSSTPTTESSEDVLVVGSTQTAAQVLPEVFAFLQSRGKIAADITQQQAFSSREVLEQCIAAFDRLFQDGQILLLGADGMPVFDTVSPVAPCGQSVDQVVQQLRTRMAK
ncbi:response regulator transcription factor [Chrysiogenes arsenatis]|uniref:response regulator transcription factor n=1 Tax=Chrysiogenes arsenatis TaxID=309797 RepID=UPI00042412D1|nr:response regulator [Chrysiogenes arsenatis]